MNQKKGLQLYYLNAEVFKNWQWVIIKTEKLPLPPSNRQPAQTSFKKFSEYRKGAEFAGLEVLKGTITVKADNMSVTIAVEIVQNVPAVKVAVKPASLKLQVGKTAELVFTAFDKNNKPIVGKSFFLKTPYDALKQENLVTKAKIRALTKPGNFTITVKCGNLSLKVPVEIVK